MSSLSAILHGELQLVFLFIYTNGTQYIFVILPLMLGLSVGRGVGAVNISAEMHRYTLAKEAPGRQHGIRIRSVEQRQSVLLQLLQCASHSATCISCRFDRQPTYYLSLADDFIPFRWMDARSQFACSC